MRATLSTRRNAPTHAHLNRDVSLQTVRAGVVLALLASSSFAQAWPSKPIRWIVPFPPGGSTDIATRTIAERLTRTLGQAVVVENRAGATGTIGTEYVAKSPSDGYTVLSGSDGITSAPHLYSKLGFDPLKDFVPVTQLTRQPVVLAAHPSLSVDSVAELVGLAKAKPGLAYASSGSGSPQNIAAEWFASLAGIKLTHVPYKGGGQAITDVVGGQIPLVFTAIATAQQYVKAGRLVGLGVPGVKRSGALPDVPTFAESGLPGFDVSSWVGIFAPAKTPRPVISRLQKELAAVLQSAAVRERYATLGIEPVGNTPEEFAEQVRADLARWEKVVKAANVRLE